MIKKNKIKPTKYAPKSDIAPKKFKLGGRYKRMIQEKGVWKFILYIAMIFLIILTSCCLAFALYIIISAPEFNTEKLYSKESTVIYYADGSEMARIGSENRVLVTYDDLPQVFVDALIATEDSRFFQHNGLDIARFVKASVKQLMGSNEGGASTLTMQLVKKTYTSSEASGIKGIIRKFTDIYMSIFKLENVYTKEEIIEFYANSLWFGHDGNLNYTGIYGVEQASQLFFDKSVNELTLAESSLLVGMYQNPNLYNPFRNPVGCRNRQKIVLKLMVNHGYITEDEMNAVLEIPIESLVVDRSTQVIENKNQDVIDLVLEMVEDETGNNPYNVSMTIYTTIDPAKQDVLDKMESEYYWKFYNEKDQVGVAVTDVNNGAIVALSGGRNYIAKGINRAVIHRQPGSTAKPIFSYGPYIEYLNGSSGTYFFDEPYSYTNGTPIYDADNGYMGMISIRTALIESRNITALQAFQAVMREDPELIPNYVHSFGINYGNALYESASIGGFDGVSPLEMSAAYGAYARGGYYIEPYIFTKITYQDGTTYEHKVDKNKVCSEETAYMITSSLVSAVQSGWSGTINVPGTEVAGKTGTTNFTENEKRKLGLPLDAIPDSWSVSYSPDYVIALWYGYDTTTPEYNMNTNTGWNARSKLMAALANNIYPANRSFTRPSGIVSVEIEKYTNPLQLPSANTPADMRITELFKEGTEPTEVSPRYQSLEAPTNGKSVLSGHEVKLSWTPIDTPDAISSAALSKMFDDNYGVFASKYYERRLADNAVQLGTLVYDVYKQTSSGDLELVGSTTTPSFITNIDETTTFYIKSSYSIYKACASNGLKITVKVDSSLWPHKPSDDDKKDEDDKPVTPSEPGLD